MAWYYSENNEQKGPVEEVEFKVLVEAGTIKPDTLIWKEGMSEWVTYSTYSGGSDTSEMVVCSVSGKSVPKGQAIQIDGNWVSAEHKATAVEKLKEGGLDGAFQGFEYGGFWIRFVARFIDGILIGVVGVIIQFAVLIPAGMLLGVDPMDPESGGAPASGGAMALMALNVALQLFQILLALAYETFMVAKYQASLGKMAVGLKVVRPNGEHLTTLRALGRYFGTWLSSITLLIGYIMAAFDDEKRTLHDRVCDTRVVKARR